MCAYSLLRVLLCVLIIGNLRGGRSARSDRAANVAALRAIDSPHYMCIYVYMYREGEIQI